MPEKIQPVDGASGGVMFYGENGSLLIGNSLSYQVFDIAGKLLRDVKFEQEAPGDDSRSLSAPSQVRNQSHIQNFFDGIRKGAKLNTMNP